MVRVHSECLTGDTLFSNKCDCGSQLSTALKIISDNKLKPIISADTAGSAKFIAEKKDKSDDKGKENVVDADFEDVKEDKEKSA